jgi:selenophosphate synthase
MIISFSLHNSCSNKMCQVILTKPVGGFVTAGFAVVV